MAIFSFTWPIYTITLTQRHTSYHQPLRTVSVGSASMTNFCCLRSWSESTRIHDVLGSQLTRKVSFILTPLVALPFEALESCDLGNGMFEMDAHSHRDGRQQVHSGIQSSTKTEGDERTRSPNEIDDGRDSQRRSQALVACSPPRPNVTLSRFWKILRHRSSHRKPHRVYSISGPDFHPDFFLTACSIRMGRALVLSGRGQGFIFRVKTSCPP